mgnify:CR=1 FL=1
MHYILLPRKNRSPVLVSGISFYISLFSNDFEIDLDEVDEDFIEGCTLSDKTDSIDELLEGFSYDYDIIPNFRNLIGEKTKSKYNTVIMVYNYEYDGDTEDVNGDNYSLEYFGTVDYDPDHFV